MKKKLMVLMIAITMLVSALGGCAQQTDVPAEVVTERPTEQPTPEPTPKPMYERYIQAYAAVNDAESVSMKMDMKMDMNADGQSISIPIKANIKQIQKSETDIEMDMDMTMDFMGQSMTVKMYYKDGFTYTNALGQKSKTRTPVEQMTGQTGLNYFDLPETAVTGQEIKDVEGGKEISFTLDVAAMKDILDDALNNAFNSMDGSSDAALSGADISLSNIKTTAVIDNKDQLKSMNMTFAAKISVMGESADVRYDITISDIQIGGVTIDFPADLDTYMDFDSDADPDIDLDGLDVNLDPGTSSDDLDKIVQNAVKEGEKALASLKDSLAGMAEMSIEARGHSIAMILKYTMDLAGQEEAIASALEQSMDAVAPSSFMPLVEELKNKGVSDASFILEVKDNKDNILFAKEYK